MRGVQWDPGRGLRCGDCGGYEIDVLEDGRARCRSCGRLSKPVRVPRYAGMGRALLGIAGLLLLLMVVEAIVAWVYANQTGGSAARLFSLVAFVTGFAAVAIAGVSAMPGRVALGTQRFDPLGRVYPLQHLQLVDPGSAQEKASRAKEPGAAAVVLLMALGLSFILVGFLVGRM